MRESALAGLARHGAPLDAPGQRLYLLGWEGGFRLRVKVGMAESWEHFVGRVERHEHDAELGALVLFDGWASKARPSVREWETRARHALERVPDVQRIHREYSRASSSRRLCGSCWPSALCGAGRRALISGLPSIDVFPPRERC